MVKNEYQVKIVGMFEEPHMMHIQLIEDGTIFNIITVRILVSGGNDADYQSRKEQWDKILNYIDRLENKDNLCITGDFNHGVISEEYSEEEARRFYNYQMVVDTLGEKNISLADIDGTSYKGYMKVDHLATTNDLKVVEAEYLDVFGEHRIIGLPDHSMIVATVERV
jgi:endonuclease/exonuclease/phosphatase family metal-dependent hydrolase